MLNEVLARVAGGVGFLGGAGIVFGVVQLGLAGSDGPGGARLHQAIAAIVGGAIIAGAAIYFKSLDTSWAG
ncbi:hypothetical protein [Olsenella profusa]|uniref:Uncharacterized protein n=1 Tax=Olsenella profusa F0195 TaxID=1125712 RepID=U2T1C1_9ACTN|nr:hypothetical protein [Olsenella profusa]ERL06849.1 hypothetical protein HMPREF1316_0502 [Olsenella profusa F0195]